MRIILEPRLELSSFPQPIEGHDRFLSLARAEGCSIETLRVDAQVGDRLDMDAIHERIRSAHGYWIRSPKLLTDAKTIELIEGRLKAGAVALVDLRGAPSTPWLSELGIESTSIRAVNKKVADGQSHGHPMLLEADVDNFPYGFRDEALFRNVDRLLLQHAHGIGCLGGARPILTLPSAAIRLLEMRTDLFVASLPRPEFPVIATVARPDWRGRLIAVNASLLHDAYQGMTGDRFPGITAADNERFAVNLLRSIAAGTPVESISWIYIFQLISSIEDDLAEITSNVLQARHGQDWFALAVSPKIREKCQERAEFDRSEFPIASYLNLIDYKAIWKSAWDVFSVNLHVVRPGMSKSDFSSMLQSLNDVRNLVMHSSKRYFAQLPLPSASEVDNWKTISATLRAVADLTAKNRR